MRRKIVEQDGAKVSLKRKCELLSVTRSAIYYKPKNDESDDCIIMNEIREIYQKQPFYGYRKITVELRAKGFLINHKKVQRLLVSAGIKAVYPSKNTSVRNHAHKVYAYLLRGLKIVRPNQVWEVDITYIKMRHGFVYLVCLIDVFSRKIMGWALSTFLNTAACLEALTNALKIGIPEIINSDQGCQFTSIAWTEELENCGISISMDGKGRWADNVFVERLWRTIKYETVFLHSFDSVEQARATIEKFITFYNEKRHHQALNYHTPNMIYKLGIVPTKQQLFDFFMIRNNSIALEVAMTPK